MKSIHLKLIGIAIVTVLIGSTLVYVINTQSPVEYEVDYPIYDVLNFDSYDDFNSYLHTNTRSNTNNAIDESEEAVPPTANGETTSLDQKSSDSSGGGDYSSTNIQELGVDEPDIVKTDGSHLYVIAEGDIYIISAYPAEEAAIIATITLNASQNPRNLFVHGDTIAVITQSYLYRTYEVYDTDDEENMDDENGIEIEEEFDTMSSSEEKTYEDTGGDISYDRWMDTTTTNIILYDISSKTTPMQVREIQIEGYYSTARMIEDYIYVITTYNEYEPVLYGESESSYVPKIRVDNIDEPIGLSNIYYVDSPDTSKTLTNIVSVNIQDVSADVHSEIFILGNPSAIYVSLDSIYLTSVFSNFEYALLNEIINDYVLPVLPIEAENELKIVDSLSLEDYQKSTVTDWIIQNYLESLDDTQKQEIARQIVMQYEKTTIHKIRVDNGIITYDAQGTVPGYIKNQFSMSEYQGNLRVATTVNGWMMKSYVSSIDSYNNVYVLNESLDTIGTIENIAEGEEIYSVRFIDAICYLVTYEQIDPFFVIDIEDPKNPQILGELKIPGYSTYLHPYDEDHIIGIGMENDTVKINLFNVADVSNPKALATYHIKDQENEYYWMYSSALYEHKAFLFDKEKNRLIIPVSDNYIESAYVFNITMNDIELIGIISHLSDEHASASNESEFSAYWKEDYRYTIQRSLFINNVIYTISDAMIQMNDIETLDKINEIDLI